MEKESWKGLKNFSKDAAQATFRTKIACVIKPETSNVSEAIVMKKMVKRANHAEGRQRTP